VINYRNLEGLGRLQYELLVKEPYKNPRHTFCGY